MKLLAPTHHLLFGIACLLGCGGSNNGGTDARPTDDAGPTSDGNPTSDGSSTSDGDPAIDAGVDAMDCPGSDHGVCCSAEQCGGATPTCDDATHACRACTGPIDCASAVCDLETGACASAANVVYAAPAGSDTGSCTAQAPCTIGRAFAVAVTPRDTIKLTPGDYTGSIVVTTPKLTVEGFGAMWTAPAGSHPLVLDNAPTGPALRLRVVGVQFIDPSAGSTISCSSSPAVPSNVALDRVTITALDQALRLPGCTGAITRSSIRSQNTDHSGARPVITALQPLTIDQSIVDGGGGIEATSTEIVITNSVVANQGQAFFVTSVPDGALGRVRVAFSTIINSLVACNSLQLDNSVVLNQSTGAPVDTVGAAGTCQVHYTTVFPQTAAPPGDNNKLGVDAKLIGPAVGDYRLAAGSPAIDAADPAVAGTPDLAGTPRPQGPRSDMGALERTP